MTISTLLLMGAGDRGRNYARYLREEPGLGRIVGVAEPRGIFRKEIAEAWGLPDAAVFSDRRQAAARWNPF